MHITLVQEQLDRGCITFTDCPCNEQIPSPHSSYMLTSLHTCHLHSTIENGAEQISCNGCCQCQRLLWCQAAEVRSRCPFASAQASWRRRKQPDLNAKEWRQGNGRVGAVSDKEQRWEGMAGETGTKGSIITREQSSPGLGIEPRIPESQYFWPVSKLPVSFTAMCHRPLVVSQHGGDQPTTVINYSVNAGGRELCTVELKVPTVLINCVRVSNIPHDGFLIFF